MDSAAHAPRATSTYGTCLHDLLEREVHPCVAVDQVAVEGLAVLELDEHRVPLGGVEEAEGELFAIECQLRGRMRANVRRQEGFGD